MRIFPRTSGSNGLRTRTGTAAIKGSRRADIGATAESMIRVAIPEWQSDAPKSQPVRYETAVRNFVGTVYRCASLNASAIASLPLRLYVAKGRKPTPIKSWLNPQPVGRSVKAELFDRASLRPWLAKAADIEEVTNHPFLDLWQSVNPFYNGYETVELMVIFLELTGNAYTLISTNPFGTPQQLWTLPSQHVEIIPSRTDFIAGYQYGWGDSAVTFEPRDIIHQRYPNPADMLYGAGKLQAAWVPIQLRYEMETYELALMRNQAVPQMILWTEKAVGQAQIDSLNRRLNETLRGSENAGQTQVLGGGLRAQLIGFSQKDMMMIDRLRLSKEDICNIFGVPVSKLQTENVNRANAAEGNSAYQSDTIKPIAVRVEQNLNQDLLSLYGDNIFVAFDDPVPKDREDRRAERVSMVGLATINETRAEDDLPPVEGGDVLLVDGRLKPLEQVIAEPKPEPAPPGAPGRAESTGGGDGGGQGERSAGRPQSVLPSRGGGGRGVKSPACRQDGETVRQCMTRKIPELMDENPDMRQTQAVAIAADLCRTPCKCGGADSFHVKQSDEVQNGVFEGMEAPPIVRRFAKAIQAVFDDQAAEVIGKLQADPSLKSAGPEEERPANGVKAPTVATMTVGQWLFDPDAWIDRFETAAEPFLQDGLETGLADAEKTLVAMQAPADAVTGAVATEFSFSLANPLAIEFLNTYRATLSTHLWGQVNAKTLADLSSAIQEGIAAGHNADKITEAVKGVMGTANQHRAFRIATTEHARAVTAGTEAGYIQSRVVEAKEWLPAYDACEFCLGVASGENARIGGLFAELGSTIKGTDGGTMTIDYAPIGGPPLHPHCRCTLVPVIKVIEAGG